MDKTIVIYGGYNPNVPGITHVAIAKKNPLSVYCTYCVARESDLPDLGKNFEIFPIREAKSFFDFKPGTLEKIAND